MNYLIALATTAMSTVMAVLSGYPDYHWLIVSDINVAIALFIAWIFDGKQDSYTYTVRVKSDAHSEKIADALAAKEKVK